MKTIQSSHRRAVIVMVIVVNPCVMSGIIRISQKRRAVRLFRHPSPLQCGKAPRPAEIVFRSGSAYSGIPVVPVQIELYFPFAPPIPFQCRQRQKGSHILSPAPDAVQNHVIPSGFRYDAPAPLCMKISGVGRKLIVKTVIHLIEKGRNRLFILILQGNPCHFAERHGKVAVKSISRQDNDRHGMYRITGAKATAEKISERTFHGRRILSIPIHAQHQVPENKPVFFTELIRHGHPNMLNYACPFYAGQFLFFPRRNKRNTGSAFPALSQ